MCDSDRAKDTGCLTVTVTGPKMSDSDSDRTKDRASLGPVHSGEALGWKADGRRFESASALLSLSKVGRVYKITRLYS